MAANEPFSKVEIDLASLQHNRAVLKDMMPEDTGQLAVVKADAYGHGAVEISRELSGDVDWFAVNDVEEGIELRENGIEAPILVFGTPNEETAPAYLNHGLTATISDIRHFDILGEGTEYHINIDTGMSRLGILPGRAEEAKAKMLSHDELNCTGIYSHFATSEDPGSEKVPQQLQRFREARSRFGEGLITHMANTGAAVFYEGVCFDMVRTGIGLYGYAPGYTGIENLKPVMRWKTSLVQVKKINRGDTVSYGALWESPEDGYIGVVPAGYEEGIPKTMTGNLELYLPDYNRLFPVVGAVTMNYVMLYLGNTSPEIGADVVVMGGNALSAAEWARRTGTIPYEILTNISKRLERVYIR